MNMVKKLIREVSAARNTYLDQLKNISEFQAQWKPKPEVWNAIDITEHLLWAEQDGIIGMWKTIHAIRNGKLERKYESIHHDMPIEQIINLTWQPKEMVPAAAAPRLGGPLSFWIISLDSLQKVLEAFGSDLKENELGLQAQPHPILGPMNFINVLSFYASI